MKRFAILAATLVIAVGSMTQHAQARWSGEGEAVASGVIDGAIIGAAASTAPVSYASRRVYYAPRRVVRYRYVRPRVVYYAPRVRYVSPVYYVPRRVVRYRYVRPVRWHRRWRW